MPGTGDITYVLGPILVAIVLGLLVLVVKWARRRGPVVAPRSAPDHGLSKPVAGATKTDDVTPLRLVLRRSGLRSTVARAADGHQLLAWPSDAERAHRS